ncbi:NADH:ubiquinone reductase (Na(+)-transporting) subunit A, partial [Thermodesulfobacteriota bacterium]
MISVHIRKGFRLNISGKPSHRVEELKKPDKVALLPEIIPFIKPRLKVQVDDQVKIGTPLIEDKRNS